MTSAADPGVDVFVLGPLLVLRAGQPVELGPLRRRATLAALAVDAGRIVPLDTLVDRVWDAAPPDSAVTAVQAYLSRLRSAFRTAGGDDEAGSPIVTEHPGYRLAVPAARIDAERFATSVVDARSARAAGDLAGAAELVRGGLAIWRGTAYADVSTGTARREATRLAALRHGAQTLAVELDLELGRHDDVLDELRDLTARTPLAEPVHALYMTALHRSGRPAEALDHFARVRTILADELGVDPGRDLQDLHARMLRADPSLAPASVVARPAAAADPPLEAPDTVDSTPGASRLIGREPETARLRGAVDLALGKGFRAIAVVGEAGIGKTRLLEEGTAHARRRGASVAWGRSWQHDGAPRLWPLVQALQALADDVGHATFAAAARPHAAAIGTILPALVGEVPGTSSDEDADVEGSELRLLDAVAAVLDALSATRPVVLVLEDLHWADAATRRATEYLVTRLTRPGQALLVSVRWPSDEASATTAALLAGLARAAGLVRIDLAGFDADDVKAYVADRTGSVIDDVTSAALVERTDGNPFFVGEIVRLVVSEDGLVAGAPDDLRVPDSVRAVVLTRLDRLDADDRVVLDAAAVVGRSFDLDLLVAASGLPDDAVDEAVDRATASGVVGTEPGHPGVHRFAHALVQQTLLESLAPSRRRRFHERIATVLRSRTGPDGLPRDPDQVVHHLAGTGTDAALLVAVDLSVRSAADARRRADWAQTEALLLRAVDLAARVQGPESASAELSARLGLFSIYSLESPAAERTSRERDRVADLARRIGDSTAVVTVLLGVSAYWSTRGLIGRMEANAVEIAEFAERMDDDVLRVARHLVDAQTRVQRGHAVASLQSVAAGLALLARPDVVVPFGSFVLEPSCALRFWQLFALWLLERDNEMAAVRDDLARALVHVDVHTRLYTRTLLMELDAWRDAPEAAAVEALATRAAEREAGLVGQALLWIDPVDAWVRERLAPGSAIDELTGALGTSEDMPTMSQRPSLRVLVAESLVRLGRTADARRHVDAAFAEIGVTGERSFEPMVLLASARVAEAEDDPTRAATDRAAAHAVGAELGIRVHDRRP